MKLTIRQATPSDVGAIARLLRANCRDPSLFQQTDAQISATVDAFRVATRDGDVLGCAALVERAGGQAEILGVAVDPAHHRHGIGGALIDSLVAIARRRGVGLLWLGTAKPGYFARFGFTRMSRWRLPIRLLLHKLRLVFRQPVARWLPAIFGRHVFMRHATVPR